MFGAAGNHKLGSGALFATQNRGFVSQEVRIPPLRLRHKTNALRNVSLVYAVSDNCVVGMGELVPPFPRSKTMVLCRKQGRHVLL